MLYVRALHSLRLEDFLLFHMGLCFEYEVRFYIIIGGLKVPYYTLFHQYILDLYTKHVSEVFGSKYQTGHAL